MSVPGRWRGRWLARHRELPHRMLGLDVETTGMDPARAELLAVGTVPVVDGAVRVGESWRSLVRPAHRSAVEGIVAHHLRPSDVAHAPRPEEVLPGLLERIGAVDALLVHGASLDVPVLGRACDRAGLRWPRPPVIDTLQLIQVIRRRQRDTGDASRLPRDLVGARAALALPPHRAHDPVADAVATAELFLALHTRLHR